MRMKMSNTQPPSDTCKVRGHKDREKRFDDFVNAKGQCVSSSFLKKPREQEWMLDKSEEQRPW
jgi:hypothetical protein